jgi:hypothetical protein
MYATRRRARLKPRLGRLPREAARNVVSDDRWPSYGFSRAADAALPPSRVPKPN